MKKIILTILVVLTVACMLVPKNSYASRNGDGGNCGPSSEQVFDITEYLPHNSTSTVLSTNQNDYGIRIVPSTNNSFVLFFFGIMQSSYSALTEYTAPNSTIQGRIILRKRLSQEIKCQKFHTSTPLVSCTLLSSGIRDIIRCVVNPDQFITVSPNMTRDNIKNALIANPIQLTMNPEQERNESPYLNFRDLFNVGNADQDSDNVPDLFDNCPEDRNLHQLDRDLNGIGDACDDDTLDHDQDGMDNNIDNCPDKPNPLQEDTDHDSIGDACDNCRTTPNTDQTDTDGDKVGNACDNCRDVANADQGGACVAEDTDKSDLSKKDENLTPASGESGGFCSLVITTSANPLIFIFLAFAIFPLVIRRK